MSCLISGSSSLPSDAGCYLVLVILEQQQNMMVSKANLAKNKIKLEGFNSTHTHFWRCHLCVRIMVFYQDNIKGSRLSTCYMSQLASRNKRHTTCRYHSSMCMNGTTTQMTSELKLAYIENITLELQNRQYT
jgi:hypothetical protein